MKFIVGARNISEIESLVAEGEPFIYKNWKGENVSAREWIVELPDDTASFIADVAGYGRFSISTGSAHGDLPKLYFENEYDWFFGTSST